MNSEQLEVIKIRANAATQGPWEWIEDERSINVMPILISGDIKIMHFGDSEAYHPTEGEPPKLEDADFIVHARQDVTDLIAEVELLNEQKSQIMFDYENDLQCLDEQLIINKRLREALSFYSNRKDFMNLADISITHMELTKFGSDKGEKARQALKGESNE